MGSKNDRKKHFGYKLSCGQIIVAHNFGRPKSRFGCVQGPKDINQFLLCQPLFCITFVKWPTWKKYLLFDCKIYVLRRT